MQYAVGALYSLVQDGAVVSGLPSGVSPRTAVGVTADGTVVFYTIDGRRSGHSIGASLSQVAQRMIELGCVAAGMDAEKRRQAREFGDGLGLAFQLRDDILDVTGAQEVFGKPIGSDKAEGKVTFVDLLGVDGCQREVEAQTKRAKAAVAGWADSDFLRELADRMVLRVK